jgi:hypothetical protein
VYLDRHVRVLENREALPRAWVVHDARQVGEGEALAILAEGGIDPRQTALLEGRVPPLEPADDPSVEHTAVLLDEPDRLRVTTHTTSAGLLMLSETYDPAWRAYINGRPARVLVADHLLRAVALPAGDHIVELRYEPLTLRLGLAATAITTGILIVAAAMLGWRRWLDDEDHDGSFGELYPAPLAGQALAHVEQARMTQGAMLWMRD